MILFPVEETQVSPRSPPSSPLAPQTRDTVDETFGTHGIEENTTSLPSDHGEIGETLPVSVDNLAATETPPVLDIVAESTASETIRTVPPLSPPLSSTTAAASPPRELSPRSAYKAKLLAEVNQKAHQKLTSVSQQVKYSAIVHAAVRRDPSASQGVSQEKQASPGPSQPPPPSSKPASARPTNSRPVSSVGALKARPAPVAQVSAGSGGEVNRKRPLPSSTDLVANTGATIGATITSGSVGVKKAKTKAAEAEYKPFKARPLPKFLQKRPKSEPDAANKSS
jgi:hypothetical protein